MRLEHVGNAKIATSTAEIDAAALTIPLADTTGWPTGQIGPFWVAANKGLPNEEKILCSGRSGNVLSVFSDASGNGRGGDGTVAQTHPINSTFEHVWTAQEADAANAHVELTDGAHGYPAKNTLVTTTGDQVILGKKTLMMPDIEGGEIHGAAIMDGTHTGGSHTDATLITGSKLAAVGAQAPTEFRSRNIVLSTADPTPADGEDGSVWIKYV